MNQVKPITPEEAISLEGSSIPDFVIEAFNELIVKSLTNGYAQIMINDAKTAVKTKLYEFNRNVPEGGAPLDFNVDWLDVEPVFRRAGWGVTYDRPAYYESYEGSYHFRSKS